MNETLCLNEISYLNEKWNKKKTKTLINKCRFPTKQKHVKWIFCVYINLSNGYLAAKKKILTRLTNSFTFEWHFGFDKLLIIVCMPYTVISVNRSIKPISWNIKVHGEHNNNSTTTKAKHKYCKMTYIRTCRYRLCFSDCSLKKKKKSLKLDMAENRWQKAEPTLLIFLLNKSTIQWSECNSCYLSASWACWQHLYFCDLWAVHSDQSTHCETHPACSLRSLIILKLF